MDTIWIPERIIDKINFNGDGGCWIWLGALRNGYSAVKIFKKVVAVQLYIYELCFGKIPVKVCYTHNEFACHYFNILLTASLVAACVARSLPQSTNGSLPNICANMFSFKLSSLVAWALCQYSPNTWSAIGNGS